MKEVKDILNRRSFTDTQNDGVTLPGGKAIPILRFRLTP